MGMTTVQGTGITTPPPASAAPSRSASCSIWASSWSRRPMASSPDRWRWWPMPGTTFPTCWAW
jgi:hypothetical protein